MKILFMGPQGSGKTTQADLLAKKIGLPHLSTGRFFRNLARSDSDIGRLVKNKLDKGELVPDQLTLDLTNGELRKSSYKNGYIIEGYPRNLAQAKMFGSGVDRVIYLDISDEEAERRLILRARNDDTEELIKKRLAIYHEETEPMISYYQKLGSLDKVDGERPIYEIHADILKVLRDS